MLIFNAKYFTAFTLLFLTEIAIAVYINDQIIRPYGGDFLVVILLYCLAKTFLRWPVTGTAIAILLVAYGIEILQYFDFVNRIGLGDSKMASIILGNFFTWGDMLAYTLGIALTLLIEKLRIRRQLKAVYN